MSVYDVKPVCGRICGVMYTRFQSLMEKNKILHAKTAIRFRLDEGCLFYFGCFFVTRRRLRERVDRHKKTVVLQLQTPPAHGGIPQKLLGQFHIFATFYQQI